MKGTRNSRRGALAAAGLGAYNLRRRLIARALGLPPARYRLTVERGLAVPMPDGVVLRADHYAPRGQGTFPTILMRTPYGRGRDVAFPLGLLSVVQARTLAARGYHVVVQTVRGRFDSGGAFEPSVHEADDGRATVEWIARQPWFDGALGMAGESYLGYTQWAAAVAAPDRVQSLVPARHRRPFLYPAPPRRRVRPGPGHTLDLGARRVGAGEQPGAVGAPAWLQRRGGGTAARSGLRPPPAARGRRGGRRGASALLPRLAGAPRRRRSLLAARRPPCRRGTGTRGRSTSSAAGTTSSCARRSPTTPRMRAAGRTPYLTVGPWWHTDGRAGRAALRETLAWHDAHLKGQRGRLRAQPVRVYVMGAGEWREMETWPPTDDRGHLLPASRRRAAPGSVRRRTRRPTATATTRPTPPRRSAAPSC